MTTDVSTALKLAPGISPCRLDLEHPSVARVHDCLLGGSTHWAIDRAFCRRVKDAVPEVCNIVATHRAFVRRAIRCLIGLGVRQFVDIGSGVLSKDNTHQIADEFASDSRVVYVDNEPVAVAHAEVLLNEQGDPDRHAIVNADLRDPHWVCEAAKATGLIDPAEPTALFLFSVLHYFGPDDNIGKTVARYRELLTGGSYLGISHPTDEGVSPRLTGKLIELKKLCDTWYSGRIHYRPCNQIRAFLGDFDILEPGLVWTPRWHPDKGDRYVDTPSEAAMLAGIGRKPEVPRQVRSCR